jgi:hypothetical protein
MRNRCGAGAVHWWWCTAGVGHGDVYAEHLVCAEQFCQPHDVDHYLADRIADSVAVAEVVRLSGARCRRASVDCDQSHDSA